MRTVVDQGYDSLSALLAVEEGVDLRQARRLEVRKDLLLPAETPTRLRHSRGWVAFFCRFVAGQRTQSSHGVARQQPCWSWVLRPRWRMMWLRKLAAQGLQYGGPE